MEANVWPHFEVVGFNRLFGFSITSLTQVKDGGFCMAPIFFYIKVKNLLELRPFSTKHF